jgi:hypothetical protein
LKDYVHKFEKNSLTIHVYVLPFYKNMYSTYAPEQYFFSDPVTNDFWKKGIAIDGE